MERNFGEKGDKFMTIMMRVWGGGEKKEGKAFFTSGILLLIIYKVHIKVGLYVCM